MEADPHHLASLSESGSATELDAVDASDGQMPRFVREHLGRELQTFYATILSEDQPRRLLDLIAQLDAALPEQDASAAGVFRRDLLAALPGLRAFAHSLAANSAQAEDLVQEAVLKAWANQHRFQPGTNFNAWLFTILRNQFYSDCRKRKREVEDGDGAAAGQLIALPAQEHGIELQKVWTKLARLPPSQREALLLVGAQGMTYEAAADLMGCQIGTVKSRVSRARAFLIGSLGMGEDQVLA